MTANEYQKLAMTTLNKELDPKEILLNALMGLNGEAGEAIDLMKKHMFHGHALDTDRLVRELGDIAWYLAEAATGLGMDLEEILVCNVEKLRARYPEGFDTLRSQQRAKGDT